ncbi:hypothetical protein Q8A67_002421 [Cirrhinus molitorella]|uniref:Uncharacterized protein n=1 Tax=Cirrhinus molitorella TaxID=172907 RepID=A0AA88Q5Y2_9TELE|nr:hypothetical protein Q8A67_002421 [Cirrhinus molitorella]
MVSYVSTDLPVDHIVQMGQPDPSAVSGPFSLVMYMLPAAHGPVPPVPLPNYGPIPNASPPFYSPIPATPPPNYNKVSDALPPNYESEMNKDHHRMRKLLLFYQHAYKGLSEFSLRGPQERI